MKVLELFAYAVVSSLSGELHSRGAEVLYPCTTLTLGGALRVQGESLESNMGVDHVFLRNKWLSVSLTLDRRKDL